uniref:T cell receptor beta, variable 1 n=1 Tax=Mus spicilegus TaxID=10103 RepID=A0A8C6MPL8_MUSSI
MWQFCILCLCVLMASVATDPTVTLLEQNPRWGLVPRGQAVNLRCILKNSQYPWMSWYQQDLQKQLQWLFTLRSPGDKEVKSLPGADYLATRVTDTELRLQVANMSQGRTLYCTCSADTVVNSKIMLRWGNGSEDKACFTSLKP